MPLCLEGDPMQRMADAARVEALSTGAAKAPIPPAIQYMGRRVYRRTIDAPIDREAEVDGPRTRVGVGGDARSVSHNLHVDFLSGERCYAYGQ